MEERGLNELYIVYEIHMWCLLKSKHKKYTLANVQLLDSVCICTVCEEKRLNKYIHMLDESDKRKIQLTGSHRPFVFGGGRIKSDAVQSDIPLLPSRSAMKSDCVKIDIEKRYNHHIGERRYIIRPV